MVVTLFSCYFLPFLLFFIAQMVLPKSLGACVIGIASVSLGTLFLYYSIKYQQYLLQKQVQAQEQAQEQSKTVQASVPAAASPKPINRTYSSAISSLAAKSLRSPRHYKAPNTKETAQKLEREKADMISFFEQQGRDLAAELHKKDRILEELQINFEKAKLKIEESEALIQSQKAELENLKFEMYTLLRIDTYMTAKPAAPIESALASC